MNLYDAFISYKSDRKSWVLTLARNLKKAKFSVFIDDWGLIPGQSITDNLFAGLNNSQKGIFVVTPEALESGWVKTEYFNMIHRRCREKHFSVIPILLSGEMTQVPFMDDISWIDFRDPGKYREAFYRLCCALRDEAPGVGNSMDIELEIPESGTPPVPEWEKKADQKEKSQIIKDAIFKIEKCDIIVVNLDKKQEVEIGNVMRKEHPVNKSENDINLKFIDISRRHLKLVYKKSKTFSNESEKGIIYISAYESKHGTYVNEEKMVIHVSRVLKNKDIIRAGKIICFQFYIEDGYYILMNVTHEISKGSLMWLDESQTEDLPDKNAAIIFLKESISLERFGKNCAMAINVQGGIEVKGDEIFITRDIVL